MVSGRTFSGIVVILLALLLLSSTGAVYYYVQYQGVSSQNQTRAGELSAALASYADLAGRYNASLRDYNTTLSLLAQAIAGLNTSSSAYVMASKDLSTLWLSYQSLAEAGGARGISYGLRMLVDYGNGTRRWYNDSTAQPGWNSYVASLVLLDGGIQATWYPQFGEHFVTAINGAQQTGTRSWSFWTYGGGRWDYSQVGADLVEVQNGSVIAWALCGYDSNYQPTCTP